MEAEEEGPDEVGLGGGIGGVGRVVGIVEGNLVGWDGVDDGLLLADVVFVGARLGIGSLLVVVVSTLLGLEGPLPQDLRHPLLHQLAMSVGIEDDAGDDPHDRRAHRAAQLARPEPDGPLPDVQEGGLAVPRSDLLPQRPEGAVALHEGGDLGVVPVQVPDQVLLVQLVVLVGMRRGLAGQHAPRRGGAAAAGRAAAPAGTAGRSGRGGARRAASPGHGSGS